MLRIIGYALLALLLAGCAVNLGFWIYDPRLLVNLFVAVVNLAQAAVIAFVIRIDRRSF